MQADSLVDPTCFRVHIKCSKTDPFRVGCDIYVGGGNSVVCPVVAPGNFLALRGPSPGPLFCYGDGRPLTRQQLSSTVQAILHSAGYSGSYSGHSFRIGAATTAPLHMLGNLLYSAFFVAWLVYRFLLGFSFPPFPPSGVTLLLLGIGVWGWLGLGLVPCLMYLLFFH